MSERGNPFLTNLRLWGNYFDKYFQLPLPRSIREPQSLSDLVDLFHNTLSLTEAWQEAMGLSSKVEALTGTTQKHCRDRLISVWEKMCTREHSICSALQVSRKHITETRSSQKSGYELGQHPPWKRVTWVNSLQRCQLSADAGITQEFSDPLRSSKNMALSYNTVVWLALFTPPVYRTTYWGSYVQNKLVYIHESGASMGIVYVHCWFCLQSNVSSKALLGRAAVVLLGTPYYPSAKSRTHKRRNIAIWKLIVHTFSFPGEILIKQRIDFFLLHRSSTFKIYWTGEVAQTEDTAENAVSQVIFITPVRRETYSRNQWGENGNMHAKNLSQRVL